MSIWLVMNTHDGSERLFEIRKARTVIGREIRCDVVIPLPSIAPRHCELTLKTGELLFTDLDSEFGTLHNGRRTRMAVLNDRDELTIGPVKFGIRITSGDGIGAMTEVKPGSARNRKATMRPIVESAES